ncbi:opsin 6, group member b [Aplochiton taeniatus]
MDLQTNLFRPNVSIYRVSEEGETAIGVYLVILGWLSWIGNGVVIVLLTRQLHSLEAQDFLTLNLALSDAGIAMFGYSRGILEVFNVLNDDGLLIQTIWTCQVDGFLILLFGLISINTLTAISIIRYIKGCQPHLACHISRHNVFTAIASVWLSSLFWSGAPLAGWGSYRAGKYGTCEIDWAQAMFSVPYRLFVVGLLFTNFFIPVSVIVFSYVSIIRTIASSHKNSRGGEASERQKQIERRITGISLLLAAAFLLAWSPYAVISMWSSLGHQVPPLTSIVASLFAKSASFYNPFIYLGMSSKFRQDLKALIPQCRPACPPCLSPKPSQTGKTLIPRPLRPDEVQVNVELLGMKGEEEEEERKKKGMNMKLDSGLEVGLKDRSTGAEVTREDRAKEREEVEEETVVAASQRISLMGPTARSAVGFGRKHSDSRL